MEQNRTESELSLSDWSIAVVSVLLTPLIPLLLGAYNLIKGRRRRGVMYLSVFGASVLVLAAIVLGRV